MRQVVFVAVALLVIACGPDPNAQLPGFATPATSGGATGSGGSGAGGIVDTGGTLSGQGGAIGSGGTTASKGGSSGTNPRVGGTTGSTGGVVSSGGKVNTGGILSAGGTNSIGGMVGTGGVVRSGGVGNTGGKVGTGGMVGRGGVVGRGGAVGSGGAIGIDGGGGVSTAACANATPVSGSVTFETTSAFCFVTCDSTANGWGCDSFTPADRTVKVNGTSVTTCGGTLPAAKTGGYWYFEIGAGGHNWDAIHLNGPKASSCPVPAGGFSP